MKFVNGVQHELIVVERMAESTGHFEIVAIKERVLGTLCWLKKKLKNKD